MSLKTTQKIKQQVFRQVEASGFLKNMQAQVKAHVLDLIDKETQNNKNQLGFQYQHPLLSKLKKYPLTSLCMDLIQEFLESFKFQHTLNVFKKQINRKTKMDRSDLSQQFKIQIKNPQSQAVLLSVVSQLVQGDFKVKQGTFENNQIRRNNFINQNINQNKSNKYQGKEDTFAKTKTSVNQNDKPKQTQKQKQPQKPKKQQPQKKTQPIKEATKGKQKQKQEISNSSNISSSMDEQTSYQKKLKIQEQKKKQKAEKQTSSALLADITSKFGLDKKKQKTPDQQFQSRKAYSAPKQKKAPPPQSGQNKIRGASVGKSMNSFLSKFSTLNQNNNPSNYVDEQMDEFQQSKDSTRKNPLFSSSQSGFDKNGFDESVSDSYAIDNYEYVQKAKKMGKKN